MKPNCTTPDFPAWHHRLGPMGARTRGALGRVRLLTLTRLEERLAPCLPGDLLQKPATGDHSRDRIYSLPRTFWCWVWQMLNANAPCREVERQVQALFTLEGGPAVDQDSGGYCQARQRLPQGLLERALTATAQCAARRAPQPTLLRGRSLKAVDGSSLRLPDTPRNQKRYPQPLSQKPGCGFPVLRLVVLKLNSAVTKFYGLVEELENTGVVLKSLEEGLLDFPSKRFDEDVWVCWKEGETEIKFWHEKDVGFMGRKPLSVSDEALV